MYSNSTYKQLITNNVSEISQGFNFGLGTLAAAGLVYTFGCLMRLSGSYIQLLWKSNKAHEKKSYVISTDPSISPSNDQSKIIVHCESCKNNKE